MPALNQTARTRVLPHDSGETSRDLLPNGSRVLPANISAVLAKKSSEAPIFSVGYDAARDILCQALRDAVANQNSPTKRIAQALDCNDRTAENLLAGKNMPCGMVMLKAIAAFPEFAAAVNELAARHADRDAVLERDIINLIGTFMRGKD